MEQKKSFFSRNQSLTTAISVLASVVAVAGFVYAATTIGTNVSVDGTLTATGASTLTGNVSAGGTMAVTGASTFSTTTVQGYLNTGVINASSSITTNSLTVNGTCTGCSNSFSYLFTPTSNNGLVMSATSTNIFASGNAGFYASSTSMFASTTVQGSFNTGTVTATGTITSSFNNVVVNASSTHIGTTAVSGTFIAGGTSGFATSSPAKTVGIAGDAFLGGSGTTTIYVKTAGAGTRGAGSCFEMLSGEGTTYRAYINAASNAFVVEAGTCK